MKVKILSSTLLCLLTLPVYAKPVTVGIAAEPYLPFTLYTADGQWQGFEIDVLTTLCQTAGLDCILKPIAWDGLIPSLLTGKVDMIVGAFSITPERAQQFHFSLPYLKENAVIVSHQSETTPLPLISNPHNPAQLVIDESAFTGKTLGVQSGSTAYRYVQHHFPHAKVKYYEAADNALADLRFARIDYLVNTELYMQEFLHSPKGKQFEIKSKLNDDGILGDGIGFGIAKQRTTLLQTVNQALTTMQSNNTQDAIQAKWFSAREVKND